MDRKGIRTDRVGEGRWQQHPTDIPSRITTRLAKELDGLHPQTTVDPIVEKTSLAKQKTLKDSKKDQLSVNQTKVGSPFVRNPNWDISKNPQNSADRILNPLKQQQNMAETSSTQIGNYDSTPSLSTENWKLTVHQPGIPSPSMESDPAAITDSRHRNSNHLK